MLDNKLLKRVLEADEESDAIDAELSKRLQRASDLQSRSRRRKERREEKLPADRKCTQCQSVVLDVHKLCFSRQKRPDGVIAEGQWICRTCLNARRYAEKAQMPAESNEETSSFVS